MSNEGPTPQAYEALQQLEILQTEIEHVESALAKKRDRRDHLIRSAVENGASERQAAGRAGVSASYAHSASKHGRTTRNVLSARRALAARASAR